MSLSAFDSGGRYFAMETEWIPLADFNALRKSRGALVYERDALAELLEECRPLVTQLFGAHCDLSTRIVAALALTTGATL